MTDDPLLRFTRQLAGYGGGVNETVNIAPLFTCQGALSDVSQDAARHEATFRQRLRNAIDAAACAERAGWRAWLPSDGLRSGIMLIQTERRRARERPAATLRHLVGKLGVIATAYENGLLRLSMPGRAWTDAELAQLSQALRYAA